MSGNWWTSKNPSEYDGKLLNENVLLKTHLSWCLDLLENFPLEPCHDGPCSPPATPCDGSCMDAYYFHKTLHEIRDLID